MKTNILFSGLKKFHHLGLCKPNSVLFHYNIQMITLLCGIKDNLTLA